MHWFCCHPWVVACLWGATATSHFFSLSSPFLVIFQPRGDSSKWKVCGFVLLCSLFFFLACLWCMHAYFSLSFPLFWFSSSAFFPAMVFLSSSLHSLLVSDVGVVDFCYLLWGWGWILAVFFFRQLASHFQPFLLSLGVLSLRLQSASSSSSSSSTSSHFSHRVCCCSGALVGCGGYSRTSLHYVGALLVDCSLAAIVGFNGFANCNIPTVALPDSVTHSFFHTSHFFAF